MNTEVGVIVGRFQIDKLHQGHINLIEQVCLKHSKVIIFLGIANTLVTKKNPLDFVTRKIMILEKYPNITVLPLKDMRSDEEWSRVIDIKIKEIYPIDPVILYGSRDSFIPYYKGQYKTIEFTENFYISATKIRDTISDEIKSTSDFRSGVIYAAYHQYPIVHPTVDILIIRNNEILLAKKPNELKFRFIGGFVDTTDKTLELAAKREVYEEAKLEIDELMYITSMQVDDWRYRNEDAKIMTTLYSAKYIFGRPEASDDISELRFFHIDNLRLSDIVEEHRELMKIAINKIFNINLEHKKDPTC